MLKHRKYSLCGLLAAWLAGCVAGVVDPVGLEQRYPVLSDYPRHRLVDLHPYLFARNGEVWFFTCRWNTDAPIGVWISAAFSDDERRLVEAVLAAWARAGLGLRFHPVSADEAQLRIEVQDEPVERARGAGAGVAVADCGLGTDAPDARHAEVLPAELVEARVTLARQARDPLGRLQPISRPALVGGMMHELGHALGFQGHVIFRKNSVMQATPETLRTIGERFLDGDPLKDETLGALYALPSGTVLARVPVENWRLNTLDRMARLAEQSGLEGPYARVGDTAARVFWRRPQGEEYGLQVVNLARTLRDPTQILVVPEVLTRQALPRSRDRAPGS